MSRVLSYEEKDTWIHRLSGVTKLIFFLLWSITSMISYDTRVLLVMLVLSLVIFAMSKTKWKQVGTVFSFIMFFLAINLLAIFFFSPGQGTKIYGTETPLVHLFGAYTLTMEQLFYEFNVMIKYLTVIPAVFMFIVTTNQRVCSVDEPCRYQLQNRVFYGNRSSLYPGCTGRLCENQACRGGPGH